MTAALDTPILDGAIRDVNFFNGRLLTARDLWGVQLAAADSDERLGQALGDGIAHGLEVDAPDPRAANPSVRVQSGLAVNRAGETLCLDTTTDVALVQPPDDTTAASTCFAPCAPISGGTYVAGNGIYLLTLCSARATEGRALTSGIDDTAGKCNTDTVVRAVQFRLLQLDPLLAREDFYDGSRARNDHEIRSRVASKCFGIAALARFDAAPLAQDASAYGLLDSLRSVKTLSDCDVPLAVLYWTLTGGVRFIDCWAVRRRIAAPSPAGARAPLFGDRRLSEAEAEGLQFEAQAEALRGEQALGAPNAQVEQFFAWLPPAAYLRVGGARGFDWKTLLGAHAPAAATPLASGLARAILLHAVGQDAVPVVARTAPGAPSAVRYRVYQVDGNTDYVLIARSALAETVARDVYFENTVCKLGNVDNVQDALDALCRRGGCCALVLSPGDDCQSAISALPAGSSAEICFCTGAFAFDRPLEIAGLAHVKVTGTGWGTRLRATAGESALVFRNCASVTVRDLHAEAAAAGSGNAATRDIGGALSFVDCASVEIENVSTACASAPVRAAACITVRNARPAAPAPAATVSIVRSRCAVGHAQVGILVVNAGRTRIEANDIALAPGAGASMAKMAGDPRQLARLRRSLLSIYVDNAQGKVPRTAAREHASAPTRVSFNRVSVPIRTMRELMKLWDLIVAALKPPGITTPAQLADYLKKLAAQVVLHRGVLPALNDKTLARALQTSFERLARGAAAAAQQGIVVAGAVADDVRIRDNAVSGVEQAIHIGVSFGSRRRRETLSAGCVQIGGNTVQLTLSSLSSGERHAVYVGSCDSLVIEGNSGKLISTAPIGLAQVEPIRLWGSFGRRLLVRGNHFEGFVRGIYLRPLGVQPSEAGLPWVVQHNFIDGARASVELYPPNLTLSVGGPNFP